MVFSSPYFLFLFLPCALALCLSLRRVAFLPAVLFVSLLFYFWSAGPNTLILVGLIGGNFFAAPHLVRGPAKGLFATLVVLNLSVLFYFKYAAFVAANVDGLLGTELRPLFANVALPAGVSFFVFQAISYLVDVRRGDIRSETSLTTYGAYQAFFPHLIAGPIVRYRDVIGDLLTPRWSSASFAGGASRFAHGLAKKILIADGVAPIANAVFELTADELACTSAWLGAIAYTIQIYFDFSGYSDMAIGLAQMFGVRFHENFERPYASRSITEFWRRWHISLSSWFRDYVYIPLGGSRRGTFATYRNLVAVFAITGLWHGAAWTFVAWGLYHGAFLVIERVLFREPTKALRHVLLRYLYCLPVVVFGWVMFRAPSLNDTFVVWRAMLSPVGAAKQPAALLDAATTPYTTAAMVVGLLIFFAPGAMSIGRTLGADERRAPVRALALAYTVLGLVVCGALMLTGSYSPFLYFNF